ncbi:hypothetical protein CR62_24100 [Serratia grimesii]|uniref:RiboL-PSP-HEPN domain-containing protein n=1 Tax=Serratia grimesii TaxID=82995 RepID=A0ABR4UAG0_9GAMM|nr:hypothetical protein CR62_24100 [Serratia grimesii]
MLGINVDLAPQLIQSITEFTLVFSLVEQKLMEGMGSILHTNNYANTLSEKYGMTADYEFDYFRCRYITGPNAEDYLNSLCPKKLRDKKIVYDALINDSPTNQDKIEAVLNVCIRLRHNLFHGNKWQFDIRGQEKNLGTVTRLLSEYLNRAT